MWWKALAEHVIHNPDDYPGGRLIIWECGRCGNIYADILSQSRRDPEDKEIYDGGFVIYVVRCTRCRRCETVVIGWKECTIDETDPLEAEP